MLLKFGLADARDATSVGGAGKGKGDKTENIFMKVLRTHYAGLLAALADAGKVTEEELYTDEPALARAQLLLSKRLYDALPAGTPRFAEQALMMSQVLTFIVVDEAHKLRDMPGASEALWAPLVGGHLGGRGYAPMRMLPSFHVVLALFNPSEPFASDVRTAAKVVLTPAVASAGAVSKPALELKEDDDGNLELHTGALLQALSSVNQQAISRHTMAVNAIIRNDVSLQSRLGAARVLGVADARTPAESKVLPALMCGSVVEREVLSALPRGVELMLYVHPAALAHSLQALMAADPRMRQPALNAAASTLAGGIARLLEERPELQVGGKLRVWLAAVNDSAEVATGVVRRGALVLASPRGRGAAGASAPAPRRAAATEKLPSHLVAAAEELAAPPGSPLDWAQRFGTPEEAAAVEFTNVVEALRWEAPDCACWRQKVEGLANFVWGWACPLRLFAAYLAWAEAEATRGGNLLTRRCCRLSFAATPPGVRSADEARLLKPEDACCAPSADGANVHVTVCARPALAGKVGCAIGGLKLGPVGHACVKDRVTQNGGRFIAMLEVAAASGNEDAASACEAWAKLRFASVWRPSKTLAASMSHAHTACLPLYVKAHMLPREAFPATRDELLQLAASRPAVSVAMAAASTWRALAGGAAGGAGGGAGGAGAGPRRALLQLEAPAQPATDAAFAGLLAAVYDDGAARDP